MNSSINIRVHSSDTMHAAGFQYINRGDTTRCVLCRLEVSDWTCGMDPFTVHSERSPHCVFVRSNQSLNHFQASSLFTIESISERPAKRQKTDVGCPLNEMDELKQGRRRTFSHWSYPSSFCSRMIEAGFFGCNIDDRVICFYCDLICDRWNIEIDDPCEVHKKLSPNCLFVKTMSYWDSLQSNKNVPTLPSYNDYVDPQKRLASFSTWSSHKFPSKDKLVDAGFFLDGSKITCFYCNGSVENWKPQTPPIAEHIRLFPHCNYARQLCGEALYHKIQRALKHIPGNIEICELQNNHHRLSAFDDDTLSKLVADRLDLPISKYLLEKKNFQQSIIKHCWMDQLRLKDDDFVNNRDLYIACQIRQKQIELIDIKKTNIIIPSIALKDIYEQRQISLLKQSYSDILKSFENDLKTYQNTRRISGLQFTEDKTITIERERSLNNWACIKPSQYDITNGGWIISDYTSKCPHCHMKYYNWKSNDDPLLIHKYLSPFCLFVLSLNPFNSNPIPIRKVQEQFTDDDIENAESRPYVGLVQTRHQSIFSVSDRKISFNRFPSDCPINSNELAISGFYYTNHGRLIKCFYCKSCALVSRHSSQLIHLHSRCRYIQQLNDHDPEPSVQQVSNKCTWCMIEDKRLMALPCRHFCLCKPCGQIKRLCPICKKDVTAYVIVYPS